MLPNFLDLEPTELRQLTEELGLPAFRQKQLEEWQVRGVANFAEMSNLPKSLRELLSTRYTPGLPRLLQAQQSENGESAKYLLSYADGESIEAVLMQHPYGMAVCLSTQVGCRMGCRFCASTALQLRRSLSAGELLGQLAAVERLAAKRIDTIDLMGIGEPLDNYEAVITFIRRLRDPQGRKFSPRHINLSTCGLVPGILRLAEEKLPLTLAISLHAADDQTRRRLMPVARAYSISEVIAAADSYFASTGRRVSYEYALFRDINDRAADAERLATLLAGKNCHVNLIPANPVPGTGLESSRPEAVRHFQIILEHHHIPVTRRRSLGQDIEAACGQLRRQTLEAKGFHLEATEAKC